jgi:hypothetical protein
MAYDPPVKVYYGPVSDPTGTDYRVYPAPLLNVSTNYNYANDSLIGYDYNVTLNGYITALDLLNTSNSGTGIEILTQRIDDISKILHFNGNILTVTDTNGVVIRARGGVLQSFNIEQSPNLWRDFAPYSAEFKFNEIEYFNCDNSGAIACTGLIYDSNKYNSNLVDMSKYKISSFKDNWTFDLNDSSINSRYSDIHNESINVQYEISANGKIFFKDDKLLPAWEQAKNFVQDRLYDQVKSLISNALNKSNDFNNSCEPTGLNTINNIHKISNLDEGIIALPSGSYKVFDEKITCNASESEGTFSATYTAIIKKVNTTALFAPNCTHTFTVNKTISNKPSSNVTILVNGEIQGLLEGGLIENVSGSGFELPKTGQLFLIKKDTEPSTKYESALEAYKKIATSGTFVGDLKNEFKAFLNIDYSSLNISSSGYPKCVSHSVNHNYANGLISYNTSFDSNISCYDKTHIRSISITENDPTPRVAEFIIPGRSSGVIIQRLGSDNPKTIDINIAGYSSGLLDGCMNIAAIISGICPIGSGLLPSSGIPSGVINNLVLTKDSYNTNIFDGSFLIQRQYICCSG